MERVVGSEGVREKRYLEVWSHRVLGYVSAEGSARSYYKVQELRLLIHGFVATLFNTLVSGAAGISLAKYG